MTDYRHRLSSQLRAAAEVQLGAPAPAVRARPRRRRMLAGALVAAAVVTPAAIGASRLLDGETDRVTFGDGTTVEITTVPDQRHGSCEVWRWRGPDGSSAGDGRACPAARPEDRPRDRLAVGWTYAPQDVLWLRGSVPDGTAEIEVRHARTPVQFDRSKMLFAVEVPRRDDQLVVARDADGKELDRWEGSASIGPG